MCVDARVRRHTTHKNRLLIHLLSRPGTFLGTSLFPASGGPTLPLADAPHRRLARSPSRDAAPTA